VADREKVLKGLKCCSMNGNGCRQCPYNKDCDEMPDYGNAHLCSDALELLNEQKYGHWIRSPKFLSEAQCSICKETYVGDCRTFNYCPSCGAKMAEVIEWR